MVVATHFRTPWQTTSSVTPPAGQNEGQEKRRDRRKRESSHVFKPNNGWSQDMVPPVPSASSRSHAQLPSTRLTTERESYIWLGTFLGLSFPRAIERSITLVFLQCSLLDLSLHNVSVVTVVRVLTETERHNTCLVTYPGISFPRAIER